MESKKTMTLGQIISILEQDNPEAEVIYDFSSFSPGRLDSYRGYYDQLALEHRITDYKTLSKDVLEECKKAIGRTFEGYKGGKYKMGLDTPVWVANYGEHGNVGIIAIEFEHELTCFITDKLPY